MGTYTNNNEFPDIPADLILPSDPRLLYDIKYVAETDAAFAKRLGKWFRETRARDVRAAEVVANPEQFTKGKLVRKKRFWGGKKNYSVCETLDDGTTETTEYSSMAQLAREKGLSHDSLRHMVAGDRAGQQRKSNRYRRFAITKIGALAAKGVPIASDVGTMTEPSRKPAINEVDA